MGVWVSAYSRDFSCVLVCIWRAVRFSVHICVSVYIGQFGFCARVFAGVSFNPRGLLCCVRRLLVSIDCLRALLQMCRCCQCLMSAERAHRMQTLATSPDVASARAFIATAAGK